MYEFFASIWRWVLEHSTGVLTFITSSSFVTAVTSVVLSVLSRRGTKENTAETRKLSALMKQNETLLCELRRLKEIYGVPFETALAFFTENPARVAGFVGKKGVIRAGADADIMVLGGDYRVDRLFARGKLFVDGGAAVVKDYFEN